MESISKLERTDFLVLRIRVYCVACGRGQEHAVGEERSLGDEAAVHKHVVVAVNVPVGATLYSSAKE